MYENSVAGLLGIQSSNSSDSKTATTFALGHIIDFVPLVLNLLDARLDVVRGIMTAFD